MSQVKTRKFVSQDVPPPQIIPNGFEYVKKMEPSIWNRETYFNGGFKLGGYYYDLRPFMKRYLFRCQYYGWQQIYAPNKATVRKCHSHKIYEIIEVNNPHKLKEVKQ